VAVSPPSSTSALKISVHAAPITTKIPPMIQTAMPHLSSLPARASTQSKGSSHNVTIAMPATVKTSRSGSPAARASGTTPITTSEMPSMNAMASAEESPDAVRSPPKSSTSVPGIQRLFRDERTAGSGVERIAETMLRRLTRHAENVTIRNVSSTPIR
jgi:hypothetical protein